MTIREQLLDKINCKTKPIGALGLLEEIALQIGMIQQTTEPSIHRPHVIIFAADHGIATTGLVNPYPQAVTAQMVLNFLKGGAAINVFCRQHDIILKIVDAGVNREWEQKHFHEDFISAKCGYGTNNYLERRAMSEEEAAYCIEQGRSIVSKYSSDCNCFGFGEMGISNTSSASLIMSSILELPIEDCIGRGTGTSDELLATKIKTLQQVHSFHEIHLSKDKPLELLSKIGGFEIAMMTGAYLEAANNKKLIIVDGFISTASLLIARLIDPSVRDYCLFAHRSGEQGHECMLRYFDARPILDLGMRLGEGTGAALAIPLIRSAVHFLNDMASFTSANVSVASA